MKLTILVVTSMILMSTGVLFAETNGITDSWSYIAPESANGSKGGNANLGGAEYFTFTTTNCVNVSSSSFRDEATNSRYCPIKIPCFLYKVILSSTISGTALGAINNYFVINDTTTATPDNVAQLVVPPLNWTSTNQGIYTFDPPIRIRNGICAQIDRNNSSADSVYATVVFRRTRRN